MGVFFACVKFALRVRECSFTRMTSNINTTVDSEFSHTKDSMVQRHVVCEGNFYGYTSLRRILFLYMSAHKLVKGLPAETLRGHIASVCVLKIHCSEFEFALNLNLN